MAQSKANDSKAERSMAENNRILNRENERFYGTDIEERSAVAVNAAYDWSVRRDTENEFPPFETSLGVCSFSATA